MSTHSPFDNDMHANSPARAGGAAWDALAAESPGASAGRAAQRRILELFGTLEWDESFDAKAERSREA